MEPIRCFAGTTDWKSAASQLRPSRVVRSAKLVRDFLERQKMLGHPTPVMSGAMARATEPADIQGVVVIVVVALEGFYGWLMAVLADSRTDYVTARQSRPERSGRLVTFGILGTITLSVVTSSEGAATLPVWVLGSALIACAILVSNGRPPLTDTRAIDGSAPFENRRRWSKRSATASACVTTGKVTVICIIRLSHNTSLFDSVGYAAVSLCDAASFLAHATRWRTGTPVSSSSLIAFWIEQRRDPLRILEIWVRSRPDNSASRSAVVPVRSIQSCSDVYGFFFLLMTLGIIVPYGHNVKEEIDETAEKLQTSAV